MTNFRAYISVLIMVANLTPAQVQAQVSAANSRDYNTGATITRNVGDPCGVPLVVMRQPSTAKTVTFVVGFDATKVAPQLPGGAISVPGGTITAGLTGTPGEVSVVFAGTVPGAGASLYSVAFKCTAPGRCQFPIKSVTAKDASGATVTVTGDTVDWLVIQDSGAFRSAVE